MLSRRVEASMLIAFEGIDGSGKSAQASYLVRWLRDEGLEVARPTSEAPRRLRALYKRLTAQEEGFPDELTSLLLSLSDYADAASDMSRADADVYVFDRYCYSALADGIALGLAPHRVAPLARLFPRPDITFLIDVPARHALARKRELSLAEAGGPVVARRHASVAASFVHYQESVRAAYDSLVGLNAMPNAVVVDGTRGLEAVAVTVIDQVRPRLDARRRMPNATVSSER